MASSTDASIGGDYFGSMKSYCLKSRRVLEADVDYEGGRGINV